MQNAFHLVKNREAKPPPVLDPLTIKLNDIQKTWNETKVNLLQNNAVALRWSKARYSLEPNTINQQQFSENVQKQKDALKAVAEMEQKVLSAIQTGDLEKADDVLFYAIEHIFHDEYVCIGKLRRASQSFLIGYHNFLLLIFRRSKCV